MTNIDLRFQGYANFKQVEREVATLQAQFATLNAEIAKQAYGKGPANFARAQKDAARLQQTYGNALAATRQFDVSQQRINSHTDDYVKNIQKQREGVRSLAQNFRSLASGTNAAYREQLRLQRMSVTSVTKDKYGNPLATMAVPTAVPKDLDTVRNRLGMIAQATNSASTQMINWGKNTQWAGRQLMVGFTMPLVAFGALSAKAFYDIDQNLTRIAKVYDTTAYKYGSANDRMIAKDRELAQVRQDGLATARTLAQQYGAAAKDTLDVQAQLAATGQRGGALQQATKDTMRFAVLGEMDYQDAVKTTIALQATYKMSTEQVTDAINYMNAVENSTSLSMKDFATAIPIAAGPMKSLGVGIKELGFLMTGMIEKGVPAAQAANALKSSLIRLYNPSKEVVSKFNELTGKNFDELVKKSKGQVIPLLKEIGDAVEGLGPAEKTRVLGSLFGAYQVSRLSNLLESIKEADQGIGQAAKALEIAGLSSSKTAGIAMQEMSAKANSASGQFKRAIETIKVDLASSGEGFMEWATRVLNAGSSVIHFFQGLPDGLKSILKFGVVLGAVAGPLLMITGLLGNLIGQGVKVGANLLIMATRFRLVNREQAAAGAVANFASKGLGREVSLLEAMKVELATISGALADAAARELGFANATDQATAALARQKGVASGARAAGSGGAVGAAGTLPMFGPQFSQPKGKPTEGGATAQKVGLSGGLMAVGIAASIQPWNEVISKAAQYIILLGLALPAIQALKAAHTNLPMIWGNALTSLKKIDFTMKGLLATGRAFALSFGGFVTLLALASVAAYGLYKWLKRGADASKGIHNDVEGLGKVFNFTPKNYAPVSGEAKSRQQELDLVRKLQQEYPKLADYIRSGKGAFEEYSRAAEQGFKAFNAGATVEEAKQVTKVALMAAGKTASEADAIIIKFGFDPEDVNNQVSNVRTQLRSLAQTDKNTSYWTNLNPFADRGRAEGGAIGKNTGIILNNLISENDTREANRRMGVILEDYNATLKSMKDGQTKISSSVAFLGDLGKQMGASDPQIDRAQVAMEERMQKTGEYKILASDIYNLEAATTNMMKQQAGVQQLTTAAKRVQGQMEASNAAGVTHYTNEQMKAVDALVSGKKVTAEQYFLLTGIGVKNKEIRDLLAARSQEDGGILTKILAQGAATDALKSKNEALLAVMQRHGWVSRGVVDSQKATFEIAHDSMNTAWQAVGQEMQSDIDAWGQNYMNSLQKQHQAAQAAMQAAHQRASNALQRRQQATSNKLQAAQQRAQQALDDKWKKRKQALQDEEDLRKRMFENEMNRIERMKEAKNLNVDYRVAVSTGNLDEAAKIRNEGTANAESYALTDADAAAQAAFEKEMERLAAKEEAEKQALARKQQREQQALQARQQAEQQALQASQARQQAALQASQAAAQANAQKMIDIKKKEVLSRLAADLAYVPKSRADAQKHIAEMVARYAKMGIDLSGLSAKYGKTLYTTLNNTLKKNVNALASEVAWEKIARSAGSKWTEAMWGKSLKSFLKWIETPVQPSAPRKNSGAPSAVRGQHGGGMIGSSDNRAGYAAHNSPMPSEQVILAQKGEFMMSKKATRRIGPDMLNALNKGYPLGRTDIESRGTGRHHKPRTGGLNYGVVANSMTSALAKGSKQVISKKGKEAKARDAALAASMGGLMGGKDLIVGGGGWMRPWRRKYGMTQGPHDRPMGLDYGVPNGTPLYSPAPGRVTASYDIRPQAGRRNSGGFGSYGRLVKTQHGSASVLMAHLSSRGKRAGAGLGKGSYLGRSGNTGNSFGPHVHIVTAKNGRTVDPRRLFSANGVALRQGGELKYDNTMVKAHKGETMLSQGMTQKLKEGVDLARSDTKRYYRDINVYPQGNLDMSPRDLALAIKEELDHEESRYG